MFCINCGVTMPDSARFCSDCGHSISNTNIPSTGKDTGPLDFKTKLTHRTLLEGFKGMNSKIQLIVITVCIGIVLLIINQLMSGASPTTNSKAGAKAFIKQQIETHIGQTTSSYAEKTLKLKHLDIATVNEGSAYLFTTDATYKLDSKSGVVHTLRGKFYVKYYGGKWNAEDQMFWGL